MKELSASVSLGIGLWVVGILLILMVRDVVSGLRRLFDAMRRPPSRFEVWWLYRRRRR